MTILHDLGELPAIPGWGEPFDFPEPEDWGGSGGPSSTGTPILQRALTPESIRASRERVVASEGCAGVDGITVAQLDRDFDRIWNPVRDQLLAGVYRPQPLLCVDIPKPGSEKPRTLSIPTVVDRVVLLSLARVLSGLWEPAFSENSFAYRPGRSAHQAVLCAQQALNRGNHWVVDLDIEAFFDQVPHSRLLDRLRGELDLARDGPVIDLIGQFLAAPRKRGRDYRSARGRGLPQGSPLSPLLANLFLDPLDRFLEEHGCDFSRYADDFIVLCVDEGRGQEIFESVSEFLRWKLDLRLNREKSQVVPPAGVKFLGFTFREENHGRRVKRVIHPDSIRRFREKTAALCESIATAGPREPDFSELRKYFNGWWGYYGYTQDTRILERLRAGLHARIRAALWQHWRRPDAPRSLEDELTRRGLAREEAASLANEPLPGDPGRDSRLIRAMPPAKLDRLLRRRSGHSKYVSPNPRSAASPKPPASHPAFLPSEPDARQPWPPRIARPHRNPKFFFRLRLGQWVDLKFGYRRSSWN